jgi:hypothetical protein
VSRDGKDRFVDELFSFSFSRAADLFLELKHNNRGVINDLKVEAHMNNIYK